MLAGLIPLVKDQIAAAEDRLSFSTHVNDKSHDMTGGKRVARRHRLAHIFSVIFVRIS